jgi:branched-chain amino acid aminotransferase
MNAFAMYSTQTPEEYSMPAFSINGMPCDQRDAKVSVMDHGFLYGDGVFEGLRFYKRKVLLLSEHLNRLKASADALSMTLPMSLGEIRAAIYQTVEATGLEDGYLRVVVTRGEGPLGVDPTHCREGQLIIIADELSLVDLDVRTAGAKLIIAGTRRLAGDQLDSRIKSLNYLNNIMARLEANAAGADEAVVLNQSGFVAEGTADNIFVVQSGTLATPPVTDGALDGITRGMIMELASDNGIPVKECSLTTYDLYTSDECFLTGTGAELIPVREISGRFMAQCPGDIFRSIEACFRTALTEEKHFA